MVNNKLGRVYKVRQELELSQTEMAAKLGMSYGGYRLLEERDKPDLRTQLALEMLKQQRQKSEEDKLL